MRRLNLIACALLAGALSVGGVACGGDDDSDAEGSTGTTEETGADDPAPVQLGASVASYDLAVGPPARVIVGVFDNENGPVGFGTVKMEFFSFGTAPKEGDTPATGPTAEGTYLPLPGSAPPPADPNKTAFLETTERGVYQAQVAFDQPGFWKVLVTAELDGASHKAEAAFKVLDKHSVPVPGDAALPSDNPVAGAAGVDPVVIDSRASNGAPIPDPELHSTTIKQALADGKPILLVISTPTFCQSRFCGPITDMASGLAKTYGDRAAFIHLEVWENFEESKLTPPAAEWISKGEGAAEPWVFLIGADGKITHRWDNVAVQSDIEPLLQQLPVIGG